MLGPGDVVGRGPRPRNRSQHQRNIDRFMQLADQDVPEQPCIPSYPIRKLRATLILEEALETVNALGFELHPDIGDGGEIRDWKVERGPYPPDMEEIADGCADISVVTIGTLSACGMDDVPLLAEVDAANLRKFGPGGHRREDGKWVKPTDWTPPDILGRLEEMK